MRIGRHFVCYDGVHIHRKLFQCRECGKACTPNMYVPHDQGDTVYQLATAYGCKPCGLNHERGEHFEELLCRLKS